MQWCDNLQRFFQSWGIERERGRQYCAFYGCERGERNLRQCNHRDAGAEWIFERQHLLRRCTQPVPHECVRSCELQSWAALQHGGAGYSLSKTAADHTDRKRRICSNGHGSDGYTRIKPIEVNYPCESVRSVAVSGRWDGF